MALKDDLAGLGIHPEVAAVLGLEEVNASPVRSVATGLTAAGTTIANALQLTALVNLVSTAAASTGVKLPANTPIGQFVFISNAGANAINVFPPTSTGTLNGGSAGAAVTLAIGGAANLCVRTSATNWEVYVLAREA